MSAASATRLGLLEPPNSSLAPRLLEHRSFGAQRQIQPLYRAAVGKKPLPLSQHLKTTWISAALEQTQGVLQGFGHRESGQPGCEPSRTVLEDRRKPLAGQLC